jgi:predicted transcriptional regulator
MSPRRTRPSGILEQEVLACLAASSEAMTPAEVMTELGGDLAYTTVMTTLSRLYEKGALERAQRGRAFAYQLVGDVPAAQAAVTARQMQRLLESGDRSLVLSRFVDSLDAEAEQELRQLLRGAGRAPRSTRRKTAKPRP